MRKKDLFGSGILSIEPRFVARASNIEPTPHNIGFILNLVLFMLIAGNNNNMSKRKQVEKD
ncbi:hypothetical protein JCM17380_32700 [Desulfosporosinus burensis]